MRTLEYILLVIAFITIYHAHFVQSIIDSKSHLVKVTTTIMIENDGNAPITHHLIDCDERNGHSRLSHIIAKLSNTLMPVAKTDDGKMWRIDLSSKPIDPGVTIPLMVTKVYTHLELVPAHDVYLMPYSSIQYQVRIIKQGRPQKIKVPSEQYYLVVDNRELVDLEESTSTALALESEGSTKIRFVDKSVISDEDFIQPESKIHIVRPSYLTMHVTPGDSWALQKFTDYTIEIRIFDDHQHQIYPSENINIQLTSSNELVITNSTTNGTYHTIHTLKAGPSKLTAILLGPTPTLYSFDSTFPDIELVQELNTYEPLDVKPSAIVLPWLPESKPSYQVSIFAAGGTGSYRWSTNNSALTEITYGDEDSSMAKISTTGEGTAFIQCTDTKSQVFLRHSMVVVSRIVELSILPSITETEIGGEILLPIAVYGNLTSLLELHLPEEEKESDLVLFHDCSKIKFDVDIVEKSRLTYDPTEVHPNTRAKSCVSLKFTCNQPGSTRIWISYTDPTDLFSKPIKTTTIVACYKTLKPIYPTEVGVLALHTSIELAFEGGPRPFGSRLDDHYSHLEPGNDPVLTIEPVIDRYRFNKDLHVFKVSCNEYGDVALTLNVGNQPSATLPNPASSKASVKIICAKPDSMQLKPRLKEACPLNEMASLIETVVPVSSFAPTEFELVVFDDSKREFLNISSFSFNWSMNGQGTASSKQTEEVNAVAGFRKVTRNYITVQPNGREGFGRLQADLNNYKGQGLYRGQTLDLTASLDLQFVDYAQIKPNRTVVYNHEKNNVVLSILKGSGYFSIESLQGSKHANVSYLSVFGTHRLSIVPLSVGRFELRLEDQCLESSATSEVLVLNDLDFTKEALKPGRTLNYCKDVDETLFCLYLAVQRVNIAPPSTTTTRAPVPAPAPPPPPTPRTTIEPVIVEPPPRPLTTPKPAAIEMPRPVAKEPEIPVQGATVVHHLVGFLIVLIVTASAITLGHKWWQAKRPQSSDSSFIVQCSPPRFSPNASRGPTSSTPRSRPLYTERFSTTLMSD